MNIRITLEPAGAVPRLDVALNRLPLAVRRMIRYETQTGLTDALIWMVRNRLSGGKKTGKTTSTRLAMRSGSLARSWRVRVEDRGTTVTGTLDQDQRFKARIYARVHEYGATIVPTRAGALTIPLNAAAENRPARLWKTLFRITSKRGNVLLVRRVAGGIVPMFLLRQSVRIPARPFLRPTAALWLPRILRTITRQLPDVIAEVGVTR